MDAPITAAKQKVVSVHTRYQSIVSVVFNHSTSTNYGITLSTAAHRNHRSYLESHIFDPVVLRAAESIVVANVDIKTLLMFGYFDILFRVLNFCSGVWIFRYLLMLHILYTRRYFSGQVYRGVLVGTIQWRDLHYCSCAW